MIPNDLSSFDLTELRGFAKLNRLELDAVKTGDLDDAAKTSARENLADDYDRLNAAIEAALAAEGAEEAVEAAAAAATEAANGEETGDDEEAEAATTEGDDAETVVDEAVAAATMGGGQAARSVVVTRDESDRVNGDMKKFIRNMANGNVRHDERHSFTTMRRETNHLAREGERVDDKILAAQASRAAGDDKTAAGCFCGPDDAINAIKECGETVRPLSDSFPTLTASGDVQYVRQIDLADALTGVTEWTCTDQDAVDPEVVATWKPCFELECEPVITSAMYAVSACATFNTQQLIGNPALVSNLEHVMQVAFSKTAELLVYARLRALSSKYSYGYALTAYGAGAQLLAAVGWAMEAIRANLRESNPGYTLTIPAGLKERIVTDGFLTGAHAPDETWNVILQRLNELGVNRVVELVDEIVCTPGGAAAHAPIIAPVPGCTYVAGTQHPVTQEIALYRPEDFVLGVGPDIDLGVTRSPELARQNKLQWFTEGFEFLEKVGCAPALNLLVPFCASGIRPALGTGEDCTP